MAALTNLPITANGDYDLTLDAQARRYFSVGGTWNGASVTFKFDATGDGDWVAFPDGAFSASGGFEGKLPNGKLRVTVASAGASTSLKVVW